MPCNASYTRFIFGKFFHMNYNLICIFICTTICTKKFILVKSGCYKNGGQSLASRPKWVAGRPTPPSFSLFSSTTLSFTSTTTTLGNDGGALATWAGHPTTSLGWPATPWLPCKRAAKGSLLHPTRSQATSYFLNPSLSSMLLKLV
jgi:hypothetical protein